MMPSLSRYLLALTLAAAPLAPLCSADASAGRYGDAADAEADAAAPSPVTPPAVAFDDSMGCVLDSNVGIAIDGSGSIGASNFITILAAVEMLIKVTSGTENGGTANANLYYTSAFASTVYARTAVATNAGDTQATAAAQLSFNGGGTDIAAALADQLSVLEPLAPAFVILITDGESNFDAFSAQAAALAAADPPLTLVCVALGNANVAVLNQLCAKDAFGAPLVFASADIGDIAMLLEEALNTLDTDGDGVPDCEDECPDDPEKTREPCKDECPIPTCTCTCTTGHDDCTMSMHGSRH